MNRYPVWKYAIIVIALLLGVIYTLPNFFGEAPAVQVSSGKATIKVDCMSPPAAAAGAVWAKAEEMNMGETPQNGLSVFCPAVTRTAGQTKRRLYAGL